MSIPISDKINVKVRADHLPKNVLVDKVLIQLKDGSTYMAWAHDASTIEPVSRSYAGCVIKENMRDALTDKIREARYAKDMFYNGTLKEYENQCKVVDAYQERYEALQKFWRNFKNFSSKHVKKMNRSPDEARVALEKKAKALKAKKSKGKAKGLNLKTLKVKE
jgi:hypothetical protein